MNSAVDSLALVAAVSGVIVVVLLRIVAGACRLISRVLLAATIVATPEILHTVQTLWPHR